MILLSVIAILFGIILSFILGFVIPSLPKMKLIIIVFSITVSLFGYVYYKIYKGFHTLPDGAHYIDDNSDEVK